MTLGLYTKPAFIILTIFAIYLVGTSILDHFKIIDFYADTPYLEFFGGLFLLVFPTLILIVAVRQFLSNPGFQNEIKYTFSEDGVKVQGHTFKAEFMWAHIIKQKELGKFLILYHSKQMGNYIDKTKLTADQMRFIKSKVRGK